MRVNVYSQEVTSEVHIVEKLADTNVVYSAVQFMLHSSNLLHHSFHDDDRGAVTFWLPKSKARRELLANTFRLAADLIDAAKPETGLD